MPPYDIICPEIRGRGPYRPNYRVEDCMRRQKFRISRLDEENPCANYEPGGCCKELVKALFYRIEEDVFGAMRGESTRL